MLTQATHLPNFFPKVSAKKSQETHGPYTNSNQMSHILWQNEPRPSIQKVRKKWHIMCIKDEVKGLANQKTSLPIVTPVSTGNAKSVLITLWF